MASPKKATAPFASSSTTETAGTRETQATNVKARKHSRAKPDSQQVRTVAEQLLNDSLGYAIRRAQIRSYELFFRFLKDEDISPAKMTVLSLIGIHQGISQSALAKQLGVNRAAMVKVIDALELQQLILRSPTDGDRRSYSLIVTAQGQTKLETLQRKAQEYEDALAHSLSVSEHQLLMTLLDKVGQGHTALATEI